MITSTHFNKSRAHFLAKLINYSDIHNSIPKIYVISGVEKTSQNLEEVNFQSESKFVIISSTERYNYEIM